MQYTSSRKNLDLSISQAIIKGISEDGGLFVLKNISEKKLVLETLLNKNYLEIAKEVFGLFFDDFTKEEISYCVEKAYRNNFKNEEVVQLNKVGNFYELELYLGPTSAFKDVALQFLPHSLQLSMKKQNLKEKIMILTATSGDTGKAALEGFKNVENILINVFYPLSGVSPIQEKQMRSTDGNNTFVTALKGNFDDCQRLVKDIFSDTKYNEELKEKGIRLSSANSINISRLVPQVIYYVYSYLKLVENQEIKLYDKVNFCVPTGNFGDILAGYYAKLLGLPVDKFICASNSNDVLDEFIKTGTYNRKRKFFKTIAPSMDILVSSNVERLLYELYDHNPEKVAELMKELNENGSYSLSEKATQRLKENFISHSVNDQEIKEMIAKVFKENGQLIDTHTATAYVAAEEYGLKNTIILSTASPYKFASSVYEALDKDGQEKDEFKLIEKLHELSGMEIPANIAKLKELPDIHNNVTTKEEAREYLLKLLEK